MSDDTKFYHLAENPFAVEPDPKYFFPSESHREALASLQYGVAYKKGFILILGEAGIGKTMLIRRMMSTLDQPSRIVYFPHSQMSIQNMLREMLSQLGLQPKSETKGAMIHHLYDYLIQCLGRKENVVVIMDEAENICLDLLEEVRLLANLETGTSKLLQIVLVGRPELKKKLSAAGVRQIKQRIVVTCAMSPLTEDESRQYIHHRLKVAGRAASDIFSDEALSQICKSAKGIPRAVNILCADALSLGAGLSEKRISEATIHKGLHKKGILSHEKERRTASGQKDRFLRKMFFMLPALVLLAAAIGVGRIYIPGFLESLHESRTLSRPVQEPKTADIGRKPETSVAEPQKHSAQKPRAALTPLPQKPAPPLAEPVDPLRETRIKAVVEAKEGLNLSSFAALHYGMIHETLVDHILKVNPEIRNPDLILVRQKIRIPELSASLLIVRAAHGRYKVHLRTFADPEKAARYKMAAAPWARDVEIVPWKMTAGKTWYRVYAGSFGDRNEALRAIEDMKQKGFSMMPSRMEALRKKK